MDGKLQSPPGREPRFAGTLSAGVLTARKRGSAMYLHWQQILMYDGAAAAGIAAGRSLLGRPAVGLDGQAAVEWRRRPDRPRNFVVKIHASLLRAGESQRY